MTPPPTYEIELSVEDYRLIRLAAHRAGQSVGCFLRNCNHLATATVIAAAAVTLPVSVAKVVPFFRFQAARWFVQPQTADRAENQAA